QSRTCSRQVSSKSSRWHSSITCNICCTAKRHLSVKFRKFNLSVWPSGYFFADRSGHQPLAERQRHNMLPVARIHLLLQAVDVPINRMMGDCQGPGDLVRGHPFGQMTDHLHFPPRQSDIARRDVLEARRTAVEFEVS